jgi:hypothetical protein
VKEEDFPQSPASIVPPGDMAAMAAMTAAAKASTRGAPDIVPANDRGDDRGNNLGQAVAGTL